MPSIPLRPDSDFMKLIVTPRIQTFSGMPEDQVTALPPEVRQMVMTGTTAMMNGANNPNPGMMAPGHGVMMDMSGMMPMGMPMNGDMGNMGNMNMGGPMMGGMMQDGPQGQMGQGAHPQQVQVHGNGTPEQGGMMQDAYGAGPGQGMMNMGIGGEFAIQVRSSSLVSSIDLAETCILGTKPNEPADVSWYGRACECNSRTRRTRWTTCCISSRRQGSRTSRTRICRPWTRSGRHLC